MPPELALLGCGAAAETHSRVLARLAPRMPRWYASRDGERARDAARRLGGAGGLACYDAALGHPGVGAVVVATPPGTHRELALAALAAGKHVLVEKPAFVAVEDVDAVAEAAARAGRRVHVLENYPYKPLAGWVRRRLAAGAVGEPLLVAVDAVKQQPEAGWRVDPALGAGGPLLEGGVHWFSLLTTLGLQVEDVDAWAGPGGERTVHVVLAYAGGALGHLDFSWEAHAPLRGVRVSHVRGRSGTLTFESNGAFLVEHGRRAGLRLARPGALSGHQPMWRAVLRALAAGAEAPYTLTHARRDIELVLRARARIAGRVRVPADTSGRRASAASAQSTNSAA